MGAFVLLRTIPAHAYAYPQSHILEDLSLHTSLTKTVFLVSIRMNL